MSKDQTPEATTEVAIPVEPDVREPKPKYLIRKDFYRRGLLVKARHDAPKVIEFEGEPSETWEPANEPARKRMVALLQDKIDRKRRPKAPSAVELWKEKVKELKQKDLSTVVVKPAPADPTAPVEVDEGARPSDASVV